VARPAAPARPRLGDILAALLPIEELADPAVRREVLLYLPPHVRMTVRSGSNARLDLLGLIRACDAFGAPGRQELTESLLLVLPIERSDVAHAVATIERVWGPFEVDEG
jgi:hypothetical protein